MHARFFFVCFWTLSVLTLPALRTAAETTDWSVAFLDELLASVAPGQTTVLIGDMEILVRNVRAWRNQLAGSPGPQSAFNATVPKWTGGEVYYTFDASVSAAKQRAFVDGAAEWAMMANLRFIARTTQANYVTVLENPSLSGGQSALGMVGGPQLLQIGPGAWNRPTICHELGHVLGLIHEHQRSDRDSFVTVYTNNLIAGQLGNFIKLGNSQNVGAYDFFSLMHYARNAASLDPNTLNTIEPLPAYAQFLNQLGRSDPLLTFADRAGMTTNYGVATIPLSPVVTNTADSGPGTLRGALYYAFDHPGATITFNIPTSDAGFSNGVFNILPTDGLPALVNTTTLDGATQPTNSNPNGPEILLNGALVPVPSSYPSGLKFTGSNCLARGFIIGGFPAYGVLMDGSLCSNNTLAGCFLGVNAAGTAALTNGSVGIQIGGGACSNTVGGVSAAARNIISGSTFQGLVLRDPGTRNNSVLGNYIGLNAAGTAALPNSWVGINIFGGAQSNHIGGANPSAFNVISGNTLQGIAISDTNTSGNVIDGNYIGLDPTGAAAISNGWSGVDIFGGASGNFIGTTNVGVRNVISGNGNNGVSISGTGTSGNVVVGNYIGMNASGTVIVSNKWAGVSILGGAQLNQVGVPGHGNVISGNGNQGVAISGSGTKGNVVVANYLGVRPDGLAAPGNYWSGVAIFGGAQSNRFGGTTATERNIISGNRNQGIIIADVGTRGNVVSGNFIGPAPGGTSAFGNLWSGVNLFGGPDSNTIGGTAPGAGNVISGNLLQGVLFQDAGTRSNWIQGNLIGLNAAGNAAMANGYSGVEIYNGPVGNLVGGVGGRNFISGNGNYGIAIDTGAAASVVQGNTIGLNISHTVAIPNGYTGVGLYNGAVSNLIGGVTVGAANLISGGLSDGIQLYDATTTNNSVRGNSIFSNAGVGIALYSTANRNQAAPTLTAATMTTNLNVVGSLTSAASTTYQIDFYSDAPPAASAEGMTYLGARSVTTSAGGSVTFTNTFGALLPAGRAVTATATDPAGNTSRFSTGVAVTLISTVNDSIPDAWRARYFGGAGTTTNSQSCSTCDADGDGMNNRAEYLAGTNPTNSASKLQLEALLPNGAGDVARFISSAGVSYRISGRDDAGTGFWSLLADQVFGTGGNLTVNDAASLFQPRRVYRVEVVW